MKHCAVNIAVTQNKEGKLFYTFDTGLCFSPGGLPRGILLYVEGRVPPALRDARSSLFSPCSSLKVAQASHGAANYPWGKYEKRKEDHESASGGGRR